MAWWTALVSLVLFLWAGTAFGFSWTALVWIRRILARTRRELAAAPAAWPAITILRPCEGTDAGLEENLLSSVTARYDGPRRVIVLVPAESDPAWAAADRMRARAAALRPDVPVELRVTGIKTQGNRKVAQLATVERELDTPVLVSADSDIRLDDAVLPATIAALLADDRIGAAMAPPVEVAPRTLGDRLSAALLSATPHAFLCLAGLGERSGGAQFLCGSLVAYRRALLEEVGGFADLEPFLGEDFEVARRMAERGHRVTTTAVPAPDYDAGRSLATVVKKYARWSTVTRSQKPGLFPTYFLFLGVTPLLLAATAIVCVARPLFWYVAVAQVAIFLATRLALGFTLRRAARLPADPLRVLLVVLFGEALLVAGALGALGPPEIEWRGHRYRVDQGGVMRRLVEGVE